MCNLYWGRGKVIYQTHIVCLGKTNQKKKKNRKAQIWLAEDLLHLQTSFLVELHDFKIPILYITLKKKNPFYIKILGIYNFLNILTCETQ